MRFLFSIVDGFWKSKPVKSSTVKLSNTCPNCCNNTTSYTSIEDCLKNPIVYSCIQYIANSVAQLEIQAVLIDDMHSKDLEIVESIIKKPNPDMAFSSLIKTIVMNLFTYGNAFLLRKHDGLYPLHPNIVEIVVKNNQVIGYKYQTSDNTTCFVHKNTNAILHLVHPDPENMFEGRSPLESCKTSVENYDLLVRYNKAYLKNSAQLGPWVIIPHTIDNEDEFDSFKRSFQKEFTGPDNAGKVILCSGKEIEVKYPISSGCNNQYLEMKEMLIKEIASVFGIPLPLIWNHQNTTHANFDKIHYEYFTTRVLPLAKYIANNLGQFLSPFVELIYDLYTSSAAHTFINAEKLNNVNFLTVNEKRKIFGLTSIDEKDK